MLMKASIDEHHRTIIRRSLGRLTSLGKKLDVRLVSLMAKPAASGGTKDAARTRCFSTFFGTRVWQPLSASGVLGPP